jgi:hypothetical protein
MIGSRLGAELSKVGITAATLGYLTVSEMLAAECRNIISRDYRGSDRIWSLEPAALTADVPSPMEVWRAVSSPGSVHRFLLTVSKETGEYRIKSIFNPDPDADIETEWVRLDPISAVAFREIASQFLQNLPEDETRRSLAEAIEQPGWWMAWTRILRTHPSILQDWSDERTRSIRAFLGEQLTSKGLEGEAHRKALEYPTQGSGFSTHPTQRIRATVSPDVRFASNIRSLTGALGIRAFVIRAIEQMDEADLRKMWIPVGALIDGSKGR